MGFSKSDHGCKMHSHQQQKQGVCPSCLRERLSSLRSTSYNEVSNSSSHARRRISHRRNSSGVTGIVGSSSFVVKVGNDYGLKKSKSIAFVSRKVDDEDVKNGKKNNKEIKGFWSKLLRWKGKKKDVVKPSSSMRI